MSQIITPVTQDFYRITKVFNDDLLHRLQEQLSDTSAWPQQPNIKGIRSYYNLSMEFNDVLSAHLSGVKKFIESICQKPTFWNGGVLWHDPKGYQNRTHTDQSQNLSVNLQVYLTDGPDTQGTSFKHNQIWYEVPYECNTGYIMFNPTIHEHGMRRESSDVRQSLYKSLRLTEQEAEWI